MELYWIIGIIVILFAISLFLIRSWLTSSKAGNSDELIAWLKDVSTRMENQAVQTDRKMAQNMTTFNERIDKTSQVISQVQKNIGEFAEIGRGMKELQEFLSSPKLRGNIGEQVLKELLSQFLPAKTYALQHTFKSGEKVDAIVKTSRGLIPIDAKFPMENFKRLMQEESATLREVHRKEFIRDVKKHITDISKKYILVNEGTVDYALMYVPSESIYYEIIVLEELQTFASTKRIMIVSPMSFYAYLHAILMSFEGEKIQSRAQDILLALRDLKKDYDATNDSFGVLHKHLTNAYNQAGQVTKSFNSFGNKLEATKLLEEKVEATT